MLPIQSVLKRYEYPCVIAAVLLCPLLFQNCQSQLNVLKEEGPAASSSESGIHEPATNGALTMRPAPLLPVSQPSSPITPSRTPVALQKKEAPSVTSSRSLSSTAVFLPQPTASAPAIGAAQRLAYPKRIFSKVFTTSSGEPVSFQEEQGRWKAIVQSSPGAYTPQRTLPVVSPYTIGPQLAWLQGQDVWTFRARMHVLSTPQSPHSSCVYLGKVGLLGGIPGEDEKEDSKLPAAPKSIHELVRRYNKVSETESDNKNKDQATIEECIEWFKEETEYMANLLGVPEKIAEYTALAHIRVNKEEDRQPLLRKYLGNLCNTITKEVKWGEEILLEALAYTLSVIDPTVFEGNPAPLTQLASKLLSKLNIERNLFTKATYPTYRGLLCSLYQTFVLISGVSKKCLDPTQYPYKDLKKKVQALNNAVKHSADYYPIRHQTLLIEQSLARLETNKPKIKFKVNNEDKEIEFPLLTLERFANLGVAGMGAGILSSKVALAVLTEGASSVGIVAEEVEAMSIMAGAKNVGTMVGIGKALKEAFKRCDIKQLEWYDIAHDMNINALLCLQEDNEKKAEEYFSEVEKYFEDRSKEQKSREGITNAKDCNALYFSIGKLLRAVALHGHTSTVRNRSIKLLKELIKPYIQIKRRKFSVDFAVLEDGLLEDLAAIAGQLESLRYKEHKAERTSIQALLNSLNRYLTRQQKSLLEYLIKSANRESKIIQNSESLFKEIEERIKKQPKGTTLEEARDDLKKYYLHEFAQVSSPFQGEEYQEIKDLKFTLHLKEPDDKQSAREDTSNKGAARQEQKKLEKTPITPEKLFQKRSTKPGHPARDLQRVLIVGDPGIGKTTLSKQLAYRWAKGDLWKEEFKAIYVIPVVTLEKSSYDDSGLRSKKTLATAIVKNCFKRIANDKAYQDLRDQVSKELELKYTLVILDGLDERDSASKELLEEQAEDNHAKFKLLMLSRPYGIGEKERTLADREVEHAGLSDEQMEDYVKDNLSNEQSNSLKSLMKSSKHADIAAMGRVPANLQILCLLWKEKEDIIREVAKKGGLTGLYRSFFRYIWRRYAKKKVASKLSIEKRDPLFDTLGKIAFRTYKKGKESLLFSQDWVEDLVEGSALEHPEAMNMHDTGFLVLPRGSGQYQFPHRTFQEYFAGRWLARQLFSKSAKAKAKAEAFFKKHKCAPQYIRMFSFMAGEVSLEQEEEGIHQLLKLTEEGSQEILGVQRVLLQMRLLNEWLCTSEEEEVARELPALEQEFKVLASFEKWFVREIYEVREDGDANLLPLLTRALQDFRAVAKHAVPQCLAPLLKASKDPYVRRAALKALEEVVKANPEKCLSPLLKASKDPYVRWAATEALGEVAKADPTLAPQCLSPLLEASKDPYVLRAARKALQEVAKADPEKCLSPLLEASQDLYVRDTALWALGEVAQADPEKCLSPLLEASKDDDEYVRWAALWALGEVAKADPTLAPKCLAPLLKASKDPNKEVRGATLKALGEVAKADPTLAPQCLSPLLEAIKDPYVRWAARKALEEVAKANPALAPQCLSPLLKAIKDPNKEVRGAALWALGEVAKADPTLAPQCLSPLLEAIKDPYVRRAALWALGEVAKADPEKCLAPLLETSKDLYVRRATLKALGEVAKADPEKCLAPLLEASKNDNEYVRWAALKALGEVAKADPTLAQKCLSPLLKASKDPNKEVHGAATEALGEVAKADPELAPQCFAPLLEASKDDDEYVRWAAQKALEELAKANPTLSQKCLAPLLEASKDNNAPVRRAALKALGELAKANPTLSQKCLAPLLKASKDNNAPVRRTAQKALEELEINN